MRSYIVLGIYSLMFAAFYQWEASLFVLMSSLFIELILLFIGTLIIGINLPYRHEDVGASGAAYAVISCLVFLYPIAYIMGDSYKEFSNPASFGYLQPIVDYKWQILLLSFSLGVGYLVDFKTLKEKEIREFINSEVFRLSFLLFGVCLLGIICLEGIEDMVEMTDYRIPHLDKEEQIYTKENKMIPITAMIAARSLIEIWFLLRVKIHIKKN